MREEASGPRPPLLIVRQEGEAKMHPFVAIIDPFNKEENQVDQVSYFDPIDNNSGFVGIEVTSGNQRTDYIYNSTNASKIHEFTDGAFGGQYGIVSFEEAELVSLLLTNGRVIEKNSWKIKALEELGTVLVIVTDGGLQIDAQKSFTLSVPIPSKTKDAHLQIDNDTSQIVNGKVDKKKKLVEFQLPKMVNNNVTIFYK